ncbi:MAG: dihydrofolate reductase [Tannerellaceae bacterium]|jgi:lactate dehydrogenase-like 2-hydroxyacid dehydrogenase|nr:dihydrofolate reductase [Tannerellaceae bacterium]
MKILFTYHVLRDAFKELEARYEVIFPQGRYFDYEEVLAMIPDCDVLCSMFDFPVTSELIDAGKNLKLIANYAVGYNNIDVDYAAKMGVTVCNTPEPVIAPTANLALGLMIDVARRISESDRGLRSGKFGDKKGIMDNLGSQISGKTLGIFGMGRIGKALCRRANACGMDVIYHNRRQLDVEEETKLNVVYVAFEELLKQSDFLSINAPLTSLTRHVFNADALAKMKSSAFLINTARGPLVDEKALVDALKNGVISGAALDVFEFGDCPLPELLEMNNVVLTPHIGTQTVDGRYDMASAVCDNVIGFIEGDRRIFKV